MEILSGIWLALFAIAALIFFGTAVVIIVIGTRDLRDLLVHHERSN